MGTPSRPPWSAASALTRASTSAASGNTSSTWPTCRPRSIRNPCRSRKPERAHRYSNSDPSPDPAVIQLVGAFRAYPQLTSIWVAILAAGDVEGMEMAAVPAHRRLDRLMQVAQRHLTGNEKASPD